MLKGLTVVNTGGAGFLASQFSRLAKKYGAQIVPLDSSIENLKKIASEGFEKGYVCDVTNYSQVDSVFREIREKYGHVDVVVNFAGISHPEMDLIKQSGEELTKEFEKVLGINLTGAFIVTVVAAKIMVPQRDGHIIHLCSNGSTLSLYGIYGYNASKHGLVGLIKTAAAQLAPFNVRVNGVAPGTVVTNLNRFLLVEEDGVTLKPRALSVLAHTPTKRFATAEGVAETIVAMCVPQKHLTGNVIFADDGYNIEGHSWPEGNVSLYGGRIDDLYSKMDKTHPPSRTNKRAGSREV